MRKTMRAGVGMSQSLKVTATPRPGLDFEEAKDKWLEAGEGHEILDYGDKSQPVLKVLEVDDILAEYIFIPWEWPEGTTREDVMKIARESGMDVRGPHPTKGNVFFVNEPKGQPEVVQLAGDK